MNDTTGIIYLKIVNTIAKKQTIKINIDGRCKGFTGSDGGCNKKAISPMIQTPINDPQKIVPVTTVVKGLKNSFSQSFLPYSITIMQIQTSNINSK
jgi:alpha-N-arabinofuranosidase